MGSVQAICQSGEIIGADASGCFQAAYVYGPAHVIWVAGLDKLVPTLESGLARVHQRWFALEDRPIGHNLSGREEVGKLVIYEHERPGRTTLVLVGEHLTE